MSEPTNNELARFYSLRNAAHFDRDEAQRLLENDPTLIHVKDPLGETALHFLAVENDLEAVRFLAQHGADVNTSSHYDDTPILEAVQLGYVDMVKLLLQLGARFDFDELCEEMEEREVEEAIQKQILAALRDFQAPQKP